MGVPWFILPICYQRYGRSSRSCIDSSAPCLESSGRRPPWPPCFPGCAEGEAARHGKCRGVSCAQRWVRAGGARKFQPVQGWSVASPKPLSSFVMTAERPSHMMSMAPLRHELISSTQAESSSQAAVCNMQRYHSKRENSVIKAATHHCLFQQFAKMRSLWGCSISRHAI